MTTIAAKASTGEIAADSMVSGDDSFYLVEKLRMGENSVYGGCGDWDKLLKFYNSLESGADLDSDTDVTVLELRSDGIWGKLCYRCHALRLNSGRSSKAGVSVRYILP
jgi:hypothetical protein